MDKVPCVTVIASDDLSERCLCQARGVGNLKMLKTNISNYSLHICEMLGVVSHMGVSINGDTPMVLIHLSGI